MHHKPHDGIYGKLRLDSIRGKLIVEINDIDGRDLLM